MRRAVDDAGEWGRSNENPQGTPVRVTNATLQKWPRSRRHFLVRGGDDQEWKLSRDRFNKQRLGMLFRVRHHRTLGVHHRE